MTQFFLDAFQWHGVKRGDAFASYAGDIRVEGPHPLCSSGGNLGNGRTRTAHVHRLHRAASRHGWRAQVRVRAETAQGAFTTSKQWRLDHVAESRATGWDIGDHRLATITLEAWL